MAAFEFLNALNVNGHTEKKNVSGKDLTYLSWPWAWAEVKKAFPDAHYTIWRNENGLPYTVDPTIGYMVYTSVTIEGITHDMWLPVMDGANRAMRPVEYDYKVKNPKFKYAKWNEQKKGYFDSYGTPQPEYLLKHCEAATMMDINKTIMRCLVKNLAMFGLGLYIYAGEDLPEAETEDTGNVPENGKTGQQDTPPAPADVSVTPGNKVPEPAKNPEPKAPDVNTVTGYLQNEIAFMSQRLEISDKKKMNAWFNERRKSLIEAKLVDNVESSKMTMDQARTLVDAIYRNFMTDKKEEEKK